MALGLSLSLIKPQSSPAFVGFRYLQPDGVSFYLQPGGGSNFYLQPNG